MPGSNWERFKLGWKPTTGNRSGRSALEHGKSVSVMTAALTGIMYVAKWEDAVYVLHCFQKKAQATSKHDKDITAERYRAVLNRRKES